MSKKLAPAEFSAYLVTWSDEPSMPVGNVLIDKGKRLEAEWNVHDFKTGEFTGATGVRLVRLCPDCRNEHSIVGSLGHDGNCGSDEVREEARQEIAHAKKRAAS